MAEEAYYLDGSRNQQGPVPIAELGRLIRGGTIRRDTLVWYAGMPDWRPASQVNELASFFGGSAPPPVRPPAGPPPQAAPGAAPMQRSSSMAASRQSPLRQPEAESAAPNGPVGFGGAISRGFGKYVDFTGRAPRSEYWFWHLFYWLAVIVLVALDAVIAMAGLHLAVFTALGTLALLLPTLAVTVRRLHDTDHSGWMILITLIPLIGTIIFLVFMCKRGTAGPNRFGQDPFGPDVVGTFE